MRLFLARWRSLPLLKLLKDLAVGVDHGNYRLAKALANQRLQFILDLGLLLLQVVGMEDWGLIILVQLNFLIGDIFGDGRADGAGFELVLEDLLVQGQVGGDVVLVARAALYRHACVVWPGALRETEG